MSSGWSSRRGWREERVAISGRDQAEVSTREGGEPATRAGGRGQGPLAHHSGKRGWFWRRLVKRQCSRRGDCSAAAQTSVRRSAEGASSGPGDGFGDEVLPTLPNCARVRGGGWRSSQATDAVSARGADWDMGGGLGKKEEGESPGWQPVWSCVGPSHGGAVVRPGVEWVGFMESPG